MFLRQLCECTHNRDAATAGQVQTRLLLAHRLPPPAAPALAFYTLLPVPGVFEQRKWQMDFFPVLERTNCTYFLRIHPNTSSAPGLQRVVSPASRFISSFLWMASICPEIRIESSLDSREPSGGFRYEEGRRDRNHSLFKAVGAPENHAVWCPLPTTMCSLLCS